MKIKHVITALSLALVLGVGAGAGLKANQVKEANAAYSETMFTIFIGAYDGEGGVNMGSAAANAGINYWKGEETPVKVDINRIGDRLWYANVPNDITGFQVLRLKPSQTLEVNGESAINNYSKDVTFDSDNSFLALTSWDGDKMNTSYSENTGKTQLLAGDRYYLDTRAVSNYWGTVDGEKTTIYHLTNSFYGAYDNWAEMTRVGDTNLYYWDVEKPLVVDAFIGVRLKDPGADGYSSTNGGLNWDNRWNQTTNITDLSKNTLKLLSTTTWQENMNKNDWQVEANEEDVLVADAFSSYFLTKTEGYCSAAISSETQTNLKSNYDSMEAVATGAQEEFYSATLLRAESGHANNRSNALSRYVNMIEGTNHVGSYSDSTFLNLGGHYPVGLRNVFESTTKQDNATLIIIAISTISLLAFGGYFLLRKKER